MTEHVNGGLSASNRMRLSRDLRGTLALVFVAFVWGAIFLPSQITLKTMPLSVFLFYRFFFGFLMLSIVIVVTKSDLLANGARKFRTCLLPGILLGAIFFLTVAFKSGSVMYTSISNSSFIISSACIMVPLTMSLLLWKKPPPILLFAAAISYFGIFLLVQGQGDGWSSLNIGDVLAFGTALANVAYIILMGKYAKDTSPVGLIMTMCVFCSICLYGYIRLKGIPLIYIEQYGWYGYITTFWTGAGGIGLLLLLQLYGQNLVTPTKAAVIYTLEPIFASAIELIFSSSETMLISLMIPASMIVFGNIIAQTANDHLSFK